MAKLDFLTIFLLLLVLNQNVSLAATAQGSESLISKACKVGIDDPNLCISTLEAHDVSKKAKGYKSLCRAAMVVLVTQIEKAYSSVNGSLGNAPESKENVQACVNDYKYAIMDINKGITIFDTKGYKEAYSTIAQARQYITECNSRGVTLFQKHNNEVDAFADVVESLLNKLFSSATTGESLISKACRKESKNPDLCKSTLEADPLSKKAESYNSLCRAAMVVFRSQLENAYIFVTESLAKQTDPTPSETKFKKATQILACADGYHNAIKDINDGIAGFDMNNFEEASSEIGGVFQSVRECKDTGLTMFQKHNNEIEAFGDVVLNLLEKLVPGPDKY